MISISSSAGRCDDQAIVLWGGAVMNKEIITAEKFQAATGHLPIHDDLERCNCPLAGQLGHWGCGWNQKNDMPQFMCGPSSAEDEE
jgi:hypothetical protein